MNQTQLIHLLSPQKKLKQPFHLSQTLTSKTTQMENIFRNCSTNPWEIISISPSGAVRRQRNSIVSNFPWTLKHLSKSGKTLSFPIRQRLFRLKTTSFSSPSTRDFSRLIPIIQNKNRLSKGLSTLSIPNSKIIIPTKSHLSESTRVGMLRQNSKTGAKKMTKEDMKIQRKALNLISSKRNRAPYLYHVHAGFRILKHPNHFKAILMNLCLPSSSNAPHRANTVIN